MLELGCILLKRGGLLDPKKFGKELRKIREDKKMSVTEFAKRVGYSQPFISMLENGNKGIPKPDTLNRLAHGLGVPREDILYIAGVIDDDYFEHQIKLQEELGEKMEFNNYKRIHYPDVLDILEKEAPALNKKVFYNKKPLDDKTKTLAKEYLDFITKDIKEDYPSEEEIQKEIDLLNNIKEIFTNKDNKEGD